MKAGLRPTVVLTALSPIFEGDLERIHRLVPRLIREGKLEISARSWLSETPPSQQSWAMGPPQGTKRRLVSRKKFIGRKGWAEDAKNWKWESSKFYLSNNSGRAWLLMDRVRFREESVRNCIDHLKSNKAGTGGARRRADDWTIAVLRLIEMGRNGELTCDTVRREKVFFRAVREGLPKEKELHLKDSTLKPLFADVRAHFEPILCTAEDGEQCDENSDHDKAGDTSSMIAK